MELLLIRHAEAARPAAPGADHDETRALTPLGVEKSRRAAAALNKLNVHVDALLVSPYLRAMQTAQIITDGLTHTPQLRSTEALRPGATADKLVKEIRRAAELGTVALCGHEPDLSKLATRLLGGDGSPSLLFHTGSIASLQLDLGAKPLAGSLRWFIDSAQLDLIAQAP